MTDVSDAGEPAATAAGGPPAPPRPRWWVGLSIFIGGVLGGVLTVGLLNAGTPEFGAAGTPTATPTLDPPFDGSVPVTASARVNAACLRVINEAQDVYTILTGLDEAVTDVDLQQLDEIVRRLQPLEPRLERDLRDCQVDPDIAGSSPGTPTAQPTAPTATASPTR